MDRNLALELVRVTEAAALSAARQMGLGDEITAERSAVTAMRKVFDSLDVHGEIVIGRGQSDDGGSLEPGSTVGSGDGPSIHLAVDALEGSAPCASGRNNALSCIAAGDPGSLMAVPEVYMDKIAVGPEAAGQIDLAATRTENLHRIASALGKEVQHLTVAILDRPRHKELIEEVRANDARIRLLLDGDLAGAIAAALPDSGVDVLMGVGGAPEGVLAAAALRCIGGQMQGRLLFRNDDERARAHKWGVEDLNRVYGLEDMAKG
ncbi:MAG: class II fructose-bisphosphatase, partial [Myxococcales bacterium]|nr:class II fructose-bisphosphatase [Myxococcales bacterium]